MIYFELKGELATALAKAQGEFKPVAKTTSNPFFKSKYADLASVVEMAQPILAKHGLAVVQVPEIANDGGDVLTTVITHSSGEYIGSSMRLYPVKNDPQAQGSAITYARRYAYCALLGIVSDDDDDGNAATQHTRPPMAMQQPPAQRPAPQQQQMAQVRQMPTPPSDNEGELPEGHVTWNYALKAVHGHFTAQGHPELKYAYDALVAQLGEQTETVARTAIDAIRNGGSLQDKAKGIAQRTRPAPK